MNNKGFTLIELLTVIVILALVMAIAIPSINGITNAVKGSMLDKKLDLIEESAVLKGQDMKNALISSTTKYDGYACKSFKVSELVVEEYLDKDNKDCTVDKTNKTTKNCVVDPSDESKYLDDYEVIVYYRNKRVKAIVDKDNNLTCS